MPHLTVEYTKNIQNEFDANELLRQMNASLLSHEGLFSSQGIRSRAMQLSDYLIGDGNNEHAFVHVTLKIAPGRTEKVKNNVVDHLFHTIEQFMEVLQKTNHITLSLELLELGAIEGTYRQK